MCKLLTCLACILVVESRASDLLWDNYQGSMGFDLNGLWSERNPLVADAWTIDDVVFNEPVRIERIRWYGGTKSELPLEHPCDYIVLTPAGGGQFTVVQEGKDLVAQRRFIARDFGGWEWHEGTLNLPGEGLDLQPGHYYIGTRLVSDRPWARAFIATSGAGKIKGKSMGYFRSPPLGYPDWVPAEALFYGEPRDFAFRVEGQVIAEPASLSALLVVTALRRR